VSTAAGSGNGAATFSGTSMASPHVAGVAALTRQAHPGWKSEDIMAAIVNTGDPSLVTGFRASRGGSGLVQPAKSTVSQVVAHEYGKRFGTALNFGYAELAQNFYERKAIVLNNLGPAPASFNVK